MKNKILFASVLMTLAFGASALAATPNPAACAHKKACADEKKACKTVYTCSMHPEVKSDKTGKCPKCGMDLVAKADCKMAPGMMKKHCK